MTRRQAELLLAAVVIARSTSFLFSKLCMAEMEPFTLMGIRFLLSFGILALLFRKRLSRLTPAAVWGGVVMGVVLFGMMSAEMNGLKTTESSTAAFLENTAIVLVPLFEAALHCRLPQFWTVASVTVTMSGIGLLTLRGGTLALGEGELLCLVGAVLYAAMIIIIDRFSRKSDPLTLGILQIGVVGLLGLLAAFAVEQPRLPASTLEWGSIMMLVLVSSVFGFTYQPVAQRYTTSERAGVLSALNPLCAGILGWLVLEEQFGWQGLVGAVLVLLGITIPPLVRILQPVKVPQARA
ncbi:DMT family transporter [Phascolarctobacterium sp.]